jgi:hypothetical protein
VDEYHLEVWAAPLCQLEAVARANLEALLEAFGIDMMGLSFMGRGGAVSLSLIAILVGLAGGWLAFS